MIAAVMSILAGLALMALLVERKVWHA